MRGIIFLAKLAILFKMVYICQLNDCALHGAGKMLMRKCLGSRFLFCFCIRLEPGEDIKRTNSI